MRRSPEPRRRGRWHPRLVSARRRTTFLAAGVVFLLVIVGALLVALRPDSRHEARQPPTPPSPVPASTASPASSRSRDSTSPASTSCRRPAASPLGGVTPQRVCIPSIKVDASIMALGLNADHTVQVPPLSRVMDAGWYKYSATAGAVGPTVILGHVDSAEYGDGVFFRLGTLRPGDLAVIARDDGKVATFRIDRVVEIAKRKFPTQAVYGPTSGPALRLITCGGHFDSATGNYEDNIIAFASLQSITRP